MEREERDGGERRERGVKRSEKDWGAGGRLRGKENGVGCVEDGRKVEMKRERRA